MTMIAATQSSRRGIGCSIVISLIVSLTACVTYNWLDSCTLEFAGQGMAMALVFGIPLGIVAWLVAVVLAIVTRHFLDRSSCKEPMRMVFLVAPSLVLAVWLATMAFRASSDVGRFRKAVGRRCPESTKNIRVCGFDAFLAHRWVASFNANEDDVRQIARAWGLTNSPPISMRRAFAKGPFLEDVEWLREAPEADEGLTFYRLDKGDGQWYAGSILVYDARKEQCWFFRQFQN